MATIVVGMIWNLRLGKKGDVAFDPRLPVIFEEDMSDKYWGTSNAYIETYFNIAVMD